jgi:branched-chain amino acid transport system substrate-binding protein
MTTALRRATALAAAASLATVLAACGDSDSGGGGSESADSITIGFVGALTGPLSASGKNALAGLEAGAEYAEDEYGVAISIEQRDTKGEPTAAVASTRELAQKGVTAMYFSTEAFPAVQDVLNQVEVPGDTAGGIAAVLGDVGDSQRYKYAFSTGAGTAGPDSIRPLLEHAAALGGKVGMLSVGSSYGTAQAEATMAMVEDEFPDMDVVAETFPETATDVTAQLTKLKDADVSSVLTWGYGAPLVAILNSFGKMGWAPPTISAGIGSGEAATSELIPAAMKDSFVAGPMPVTFLTAEPGSKPEGAAAVFEKAYLEAQGDDQFDALDTVGAISFDWAALVAQAVKANGSADPKELKAKLTDGTELDGANGTYVFGPDERIGIAGDQLALFLPGQPCTDGLCVMAPEEGS